MNDMEKCLERVPVNMPESLKRDLQDLADLEERTTGEYIRLALELHVYGARRRLKTEGHNRSCEVRNGPR